MLLDTLLWVHPYWQNAEEHIPYVLTRNFYLTHRTCKPSSHFFFIYFSASNTIEESALHFDRFRTRRLRSHEIMSEPHNHYE
ncbi:hypothetical protein GE061_014714 [Apolygus lucorum]|uniref:Uncharacterized protein n=1 Tax=Apolygus lucorum TaxID=248454 RepID=A0A8S9XL13_APOLU|nr:hypothetical protein GE061_014714 [Apolygus lucorum]